MQQNQIINSFLYNNSIIFFLLNIKQIYIPLNLLIIHQNTAFQILNRLIIHTQMCKKPRQIIMNFYHFPHPSTLFIQLHIINRFSCNLLLIISRPCRNQLQKAHSQGQIYKWIKALIFLNFLINLNCQIEIGSLHKSASHNWK